MSIMNDGSEPARSNQACARCYRRKKKCSRTLPRCAGCEHAQVTCSFEEQCGENGLFPITYVKNVERRAALLEDQVRRLLASSNTGHDGPEQRPSSASAAAVTTPGSAGSFPSNTREPPTQLASELKHLSLETAADRYLGSSSGVSFAKLTQAVLRRLGPDQYTFGYNSPTILPQVVANDETPAVEDVSETATPQLDYPSSLPNREDAMLLAEYYFAHSHLLYPFVRKTWFMDQLRLMYQDEPLTQTQLSPSWLYSMWMVLAIGATSAASIMPGVSDEAAVRYWKNAQAYFYPSLSSNDMVALNALLFQISYSFFNRVGLNTWFIVGAAVRLAIGVGLHAAPNEAIEKLPLDVQQYRKRLFWSLYMADRVVSISLGRPFGIRDEDIEIDLFAATDDENLLPDRIVPQPLLRPSDIAVPLHIVALRKIAGEIFDTVYTMKNRDLTVEQKDDIQNRLHGKLVDWRRNMPFPLPQSRMLQVPHTCNEWFDFNFHMQLVMLYRPSPMCPSLTLEKVHLIADSAVAAIRQVAAMRREHRYSFNWLNLFNVFTITLTLIYAITAQPEPLPVYLTRSDALTDLELARDALAGFAEKLPAASKCQRLVQDIMQRLKAQLGGEAVRQQQQDTLQVMENDRDPSDFLETAPSGGLTPILFGSAFEIDYPMSYPSFYTGDDLYDQLQSFIAGVESAPDMNGDWLMT